MYNRRPWRWIGAGSNLGTGDDCNGANSVSVLHVCGDNNILGARTSQQLARKGIALAPREFHV
jgi:hypothetical protein